MCACVCACEREATLVPPPSTARANSLRHPLLSQCYEDVRKTLEVCDITTDNNCFVEMKTTGSTPPGNKPPPQHPTDLNMFRTLCSDTVAFSAGFCISMSSICPHSSNRVPGLLPERRHNGEKQLWVCRRSDEKVRLAPEVAKVFTFCT